MATGKAKSGTAEDLRRSGAAIRRSSEKSKVPKHVRSQAHRTTRRATPPAPHRSSRVFLDPAEGTKQDKNTGDRPV